MYILVFMVVTILITLLVVAILLLKANEKKFNGIPETDPLFLKSKLFDWNEAHYEVFNNLAECLTPDEDSFEKLNLSLLDLMKLEPTLAFTQYTISYFNVAKNIILVLMDNNYMLTEAQLIHVISLSQIMGNLFNKISRDQNV